MLLCKEYYDEEILWRTWLSRWRNYAVDVLMLVDDEATCCSDKEQIKITHAIFHVSPATRLVQRVISQALHIGNAWWSPILWLVEFGQLQSMPDRRHLCVCHEQLSDYLKPFVILCLSNLLLHLFNSKLRDEGCAQNYRCASIFFVCKRHKVLGKNLPIPWQMPYKIFLKLSQIAAFVVSQTSSLSAIGHRTILDRIFAEKTSLRGPPSPVAHTKTEPR